MSAVIEEVTRHIERRIVPIDTVSHEIVADHPHVYGYHVKVLRFRRHELFIKSAMSAAPSESAMTDEWRDGLAHGRQSLPRTRSQVTGRRAQGGLREMGGR